MEVQEDDMEVQEEAVPQLMVFRPSKEISVWASNGPYHSARF